MQDTTFYEHVYGMYKDSWNDWDLWLWITLKSPQVIRLQAPTLQDMNCRTANYASLGKVYQFVFKEVERWHKLAIYILIDLFS